jgi:hypothetical protein
MATVPNPRRHSGARKRKTTPTKAMQNSREPHVQRATDAYKGPRGGSDATEPAASELVTSSETFVASCLSAAHIEWCYERYVLPTGLTGKGMRNFVPDFYLPEYELYLEVTEKRFLDRKQSKIRRVGQNGVQVLLVGPLELDELKRGATTILQFIMDAVADDAAASEQQRLAEDRRDQSAA